MAVSLSKLGWILLGPADLLASRFFSLFSTIGTVITIVLMGDGMTYLGGGGDSLSGSVVKTEANWLFSKFASFWVSVTSPPSSVVRRLTQRLAWSLLET